MNATTTTYTYHPTDEIKDQTISGVTKTFLYTIYGSQTTSFDAANAVTTSAYDTAERLLTVTPPAGGAATYTYDALGRIATKTIGASVDTFSYLGSTKTAWQIANTGGSGITTKSALDATGARTAVTGNALTGYLGFDLHGNTVLAENGAKTITDALRYDAWGELIASTTSALPTPWRYQGRLDVGPDASNPLYDFGARAYRPVTGAFTSLDSYAGQAIDPLSMNRFLYAEANPSSFVDPDGHCIRYEDSVCADHQNSAAQQQAAAAQHQKDVAKRADSIESAYIKHAHAGGAATPVPVPSGCLPGRGNSLGCDASRSSRLGTSYDIAVDAYHDQQASRAADPGGGWASFATFYAGLLAGGAGSAVLDLFLGTASEFGTQQLVTEAATGCVAARDECEQPAEQYISQASRGLSFTDSQLQSQLEQHGSDWGVGAPNNAAAREDFMSQLVNHIDSPSTLQIEGTYRGSPAIHFVDPATRLNVYFDDGGGFWGTFRLGANQLERLLREGKL